VSADLDPSQVDPAERDGLTRLAERVARTAGDLVRERSPEQVRVAATKSSATDVVTEMDTAAEALIRELLLHERPQDGLLGEEGGATSGTSGLTWVIDPIDGTTNYLYGVPAYAVSVAVVTGDPTVDGAWSPLAGCVHDIARGETWTATLGGGAHLDGRRLTAPEPPSLARALVGTGFGYLPERRRAQGRVLAELLPQVRDVRRFGSSALDLCAVAAGRLDAYYERGLNPWDVAAGVLLVTESGGVVRGPAGEPAGNRLLLAGPASLLDELASLLDALGVLDDDRGPGGPAT
jgi:myo-inositol-1(or 4)-monophosphatase